jgi:L-alanine-DL-glutamate epimerase-like enolase superfamily enzyme
MNRRNFLTAAAGAALVSNPLARLRGADSATPEYQKPVFNLHKLFDAPVKIASIELLQAGRVYLLRTRSADGAEGIVQTKDIEDYIPILMHRVIPHFLGKDARDLEDLVDEVYLTSSNYKLAGQAFWCPVAYVEQSLFDLMGKALHKPAGELMGGVLRKEIPVYLSGSGRDTTAEEEVDVYVRGVEATGAKAVKFKIGGRMNDNDAYHARTDKLLELAQKKLGGKVTLMADANGSYNAAKAIEIGKRLEQMKYLWFEEPCPWEELSETKKVADALTMKVAFGEQDSSLWLFQWMIENKVIDVVQPDLNYNGGFIRAARVARMARKANNMWICPHNTQTGAASVNILQFASSTPNIGPYMEYVSRGPARKESWYTPNFEIKNGVIAVPPGPGMGLEFDPDYLKKATVVKL